MLDELDATAIYRRPDANGHAEDREPKAADDLRASDIADVFAALAVIPNESEAEWNGWKAIALAVHAATGGGEAGFLAFDYWSKKNPAYDAAKTRECWAEVSQRPGNRSGMGKLVHLARKAVPTWRKPSEIAKDWVLSSRDEADPYTAYGARYGRQHAEDEEEDWASYARASTFYSAATLRDRAVPPREWLVDDLVPMKTVTLFYGDGGTGKSLLALQLAVAVTVCGTWLGRAVNQGRAIVLSAEDDNDELHRRLDGILRATGLQYDDIAGLTLRSVAGECALLAVEDKVALTQTALFQELDARATDDQPVSIVIDTLADVYPANENDRAKVRQFIGILRGLALRHRCAVVLLAHPSLTGLNSGTGTSGSTGWNNSVRSRLYLERIVEKGEGNQYEPDPDKRVLTTKKSNYSRIGSEIVMTWKDGVFVADQVEGESLLDVMSATMKAERVFLGLLREMNKQGRRVNAVSSSSYAPKVFAGHPKSEGCTKTVLKNAMERLLSSEKIVIKHEGPPSRRVSYLAVADASDG